MPKQKENTDSKNRIIGIIVFVILIVAIGFYVKNNSDRPSYDAPEVDRPYLGNKEAQMVLTEYSDFACPACASASKMVHDLAEKYKDKLKVEVRHYPLITIHSNAFAAAVAAECANDQGKFWEYHDKLFKVNNDQDFTDENLKSYAQELNLDIDLWQICVDSKERDKVIKKDTREARTFGFNGTPSFVLNDMLVKNWRDLDKMLEMEFGGYLDEDE